MHTLPHPSVAQRCRVGTIRAVLRSAVPAGCAGYFAMISISRPARMRYTMRRRLTRKLRRPASSLLITLHRSRHPPDDDLVAAEIAAFDGFWQCQFPHTGLSCTQARDIGAPSAENADFVVIQTHLSPLVFDRTQNNQALHVDTAAGGGRSSAISRRISANRFLGMATSAI
jgi:hypothetical protein